jgi:hypothetical protein
MLNNNFSTTNKFNAIRIKIKKANIILFLLVIFFANAIPSSSSLGPCTRCNNSSISNGQLSIGFGSQCLDTVRFNDSDGKWSDIFSIERFAISSDSLDSFKVSDQDFEVLGPCINGSDGIVAALGYNGLNITRKISIPDPKSPIFHINYVILNENNYSLENVAFYELITYSNSTRGSSSFKDDGLWVFNNDYIRCRLKSDLPFEAYGVGRWDKPVESDWSNVLGGIEAYETETAKTNLSLAMKWILGDISPNGSKKLILEFTLNKSIPATQLLISPESWNVDSCERCTENDIKLALSAKGSSNIYIKQITSPEWIGIRSPLPLDVVLNPGAEINMRAVLDTTHEIKNQATLDLLLQLKIIGIIVYGFRSQLM